MHYDRRVSTDAVPRHQPQTLSSSRSRRGRRRARTLIRTPSASHETRALTFFECHINQA